MRCPHCNQELRPVSTEPPLDPIPALMGVAAAIMITALVIIFIH